MGGFLLLAWWPGNEALKGRDVVAGSVKLAANNVNGTVLEGLIAGEGGFLFHDDGTGGAGILCTAAADTGVWHISRVDVSGARTLLEIVDRAEPYPTTFRVLLRASMVEIYWNDILVVPFPLAGNMRLGGPHALRGGRPPAIDVELVGDWADLRVRAYTRAWDMSLAALHPMDEVREERAKRE